MEERRMQKYQNSDFALNKHSEGIVYRFADGIVEVTLADYLLENPGKTASDFRKLKELSDADYRERDRREFRQTWKDTPICDLRETTVCASPSPEAEIIDTPDEAARQVQRAAIATRVWGELTAIQNRRYLKHQVVGMSTRQIAEQEGVAQRTVMDSLELAEKKIKKILGEG
jgi:hypothetical protein